jgi:hypothetical protein
MVASNKQTKSKPKRPMAAGEILKVVVTVEMLPDGRENLFIEGPDNRCETQRILGRALYSTANKIDEQVAALKAQLAAYENSQLILPNKDLTIVTS